MIEPRLCEACNEFNSNCKCSGCNGCLEQSRLLGMSGSREAALLARIEELKHYNEKRERRIEGLESENARLRKALEKIGGKYDCEYQLGRCSCCDICIARSALEGEKDA